MLYMSNFYSTEELDMFSFPRFDDAAQMAEVDVKRCDSAVSTMFEPEFSFEKFKREMLAERPNKKSKSQPPSPPDSGSVSPVGPERLRSLIPPPNYGTVERDMMYRSSFPQARNMDFMKVLKIRSVLTLVDTEPAPAYQEWMFENNIKQLQINIATNKDGKINTTMSSVCQALLFILDSTHWPVYIHCNQGKHRTGCVVACFRLTQGWPMDEVIDEYRTYASVKARDGDIALIKSFKPAYIGMYRRYLGMERSWPMKNGEDAALRVDEKCDEIMED